MVEFIRSLTFTLYISPEYAFFHGLGAGRFHSAGRIRPAGRTLPTPNLQEIVLVKYWNQKSAPNINNKRLTTELAKYTWNLKDNTSYNIKLALQTVLFKKIEYDKSEKTFIITTS